MSKFDNTIPTSVALRGLCFGSSDTNIGPPQSSKKSMSEGYRRQAHHNIPRFAAIKRPLGGRIHIRETMRHSRCEDQPTGPTEAIL